MLKINSIFYSLQGEGIQIGQPMLFIRLSGCNIRCDWCLTKNININTPKGVKKIHEIKKNDLILSYNIEEKKIEPVKVLRSLKHGVNEIIKISFFTGGPLYTTEEHPFYCNGKWKKAIDLKINDEIYQIKHNTHMFFNNPMKNPEIAKQVGIKISKTTKGRKHSAIHNMRVQIAKAKNPTRLFGEKNGNWHGGIANKKPHRNERLWKELKVRVYKRDNYSCQMCGATSDLVCHHVDYNNENNKIENLVTLCRKCNSSINHGRYNFDFKVSNGRKIKLIERINFRTNPKAYVRLSNNKRNQINVYNLEVEKNNNYFANGLLVHNCDTTYHNQGEYWKLSDLRKEIITKYDTVKTIFLTGGEPLFQDILPLVKMLKKLKKNVIVQTNGTFYNKKVFDLVDFISIDFKPPSAKVVIEPHLIFSILKLYHEKIQVKFVIDDMNDLLFFDRQIDYIYKKIPIILQPCSELKKINMICDYILSDNRYNLWDIRILPQLQRIIWGSEKNK